MDTFILILNLSVGIIGIVLIWFGYQKDKTSKPEAKGILGKRILILTLVVAICNSIAIPLIGHLKEKPPPAATKEDVRQIVAEYMGEKPKNPPVEEVKSEIEKELKAAFEKQEKQALLLYQKGNKAYEQNQFKKAITHFEWALKIVKIPSFYLSLGNSFIVTSDFRKALTTYQTALKLYQAKKDRKGEGNALGNLGLAYYALGQVEKAIEYYEQALAISREIGHRRGEGIRLGNLGNAYRALGQVEKAIEYYKQSLLIFEEIKSPYAEQVRKWLAELDADGK
jgi:tetratricopeptide (TPR) repeat protein